MYTKPAPRENISSGVSSQRGGGGYSDIFIHTFFGFKFLNIFFWGGGGGGVVVVSEKLIFFGYEDFGDIFWGHLNWTIFRGNFYAI